MTWGTKHFRTAYIPSCSRWIASWQLWTAPQSRGLVRFRFTLQMVALALNLCVQLNILKDCPICNPGMQLECNEITWRLTLCWLRSTTSCRGAVLRFEKTRVGVSIGSYPRRRLSWTLACTMTLSTRLGSSSQPDASISGFGIMFGRSPSGLAQCVPIHTILRSGNHGWKMGFAFILQAKRLSTRLGSLLHWPCHFMVGGASWTRNSPHTVHAPYGRCGTA